MKQCFIAIAAFIALFQFEVKVMYVIFASAFCGLILYIGA
jgi:chromate transporter